MGLGFTFFTNSKDQQNEISILKEMVQGDESLGMFEHPEESEHIYFNVEFCPGGELFLLFNNGTITSDCQTNVAGPGFHVRAIEFIEEYASRCGLTFILTDETMYYAERDFQKMKDEHFNVWLKKIFTIIADDMKTMESEDWLVCWPMDTFVPKPESGTAYSPMGGFKPQAVLDQMEMEGVESFAKDFFVWNSREKDAWYYRNSALFLMWSYCYFMPSIRSETDWHVNDLILKLLDVCAAMDSTIPFPVKEYREICALHGVGGIPVETFPPFEYFDSIGYRKGLVFYPTTNDENSSPREYVPGCDLL